MFYLSLIIGLMILVLTSKLIRIYKLSGNYLLLSQICASFIVILLGDLKIVFVNQIALGYLSIPVSLLFLIGISNIMNMEREQKPLLLLMPCITLVCLSLFGLMTGRTSVLIMGSIAVLFVVLIMLHGTITGNVHTGRIVMTSISFVIAVLSLALSSHLFHFFSIYIPIFTLAIPLALVLLLQKKLTSVQSIAISSILALIFGLLTFMIPLIDLYLVIGFTIVLIISQCFRKYRFI